MVGPLVGESVGTDVGTGIGTDVGPLVGESVGTDVGMSVGIDVGTGVGRDVGCGDIVGIAVGGGVDGVKLKVGKGLTVGNDVSIDGSEHHCTSLSAVQLLPNESFPSVESSIAAS